MNDHSFSLQPLSPLTPLTNLKITGNITRRFNNLNVRHALLGKLTPLMIPPPAVIPVRQNHLWEEPLGDIKVSKNRVAFVPVGA